MLLRVLLLRALYCLTSVVQVECASALVRLVVLLCWNYVLRWLPALSACFLANERENVLQGQPFFFL